MNEVQLKYADDCIDKLNKSYPKSDRLNSRFEGLKYEETQKVIGILEIQNWIERSGVQYKLLKTALPVIDEFGSYSNYYKHDLDKENQAKQKAQIETDIAILEKENFEYLSTIREQETRNRSLEEQTKLIELLKLYWWLLLTCIGIGIGIKELWDLIML